MRRSDQTIWASAVIILQIFRPGVDHAYTAKEFLKSSPESHQRLHLLLGQIDIGDDLEEFDTSNQPSIISGGRCHEVGTDRILYGF